MTPAEREAIAARHVQDLGPMAAWCRGCGKAWPCDAARLLDALREDEQAAEADRRVLLAALREAEAALDAERVLRDLLGKHTIQTHRP